AHFIALFFASTYVDSLYVSKRTRLEFSTEPHVTNSRYQQKENHERWRDDDGVIRSSRAQFLRCVFWRFLEAMDATMPRLGLAMHPTRLRLTPYLITSLLFTGPLYVIYLSGALPFMSDWSYDIDVHCKSFTLQGIRNCIMATQAPITEEVVFRACILAIYDLSGTSRTRMIFYASTVWIRSVPPLLMNVNLATSE
ncbi:hypothetical protein F5887DRAFT_896246, partial [Amanita rubescens]